MCIRDRVKKIFTNNGMASKDLIKQFLHKRSESGEIVITKNIDELSEHEVDSIAVGYVQYITMLEEKENLNANAS